MKRCSDVSGTKIKADGKYLETLQAKINKLSLSSDTNKSMTKNTVVNTIFKKIISVIISLITKINQMAPWLKDVGD